MTLLNVHHAAGAVHLMSDTLQYNGKRPAGLLTSKVEIAENNRFGFGCRGSSALAEGVGHMLRGQASVDHGAEAVRIFLTDLPDDLAEGLLGKGFEVTLAGWTEATGEPTVIRVTLPAGRSLRAEHLPPGVYLAPTSANPPPLPRSVTADQFSRLALAQWRLQGRMSEKLCIGGVMHLTTITAEDARQSIVGIFPDYDDHAKRFGDPNADAVAVFRAAEERSAA